MRNHARSHARHKLASASIIALATIATPGLAASLPIQANDAQAAKTEQPPSPSAGQDSAGNDGASQPQDNADSSSDAPVPVGDIVVTGSRVVRNGFQSPTPTTVLGADQLRTAATVTIADTINQLPVFSNSVTSHTTNVAGSTGLVGINQLNLRGLGANRTLVLLDGQRVAPADASGAADANIIPTGLIKRVDVVTGGASASYGSDAVAGVVNFVLDHEFEGVRLDLNNSITTYGDDAERKGSITLGKSFAGGRGHILAYGEYSHLDGITGRARPWEQYGSQIVSNPAYGTGAGQSTSVPALLVRDSVGLADAAPGGLITSGPLRGTTFGPGGTPFQLNYGTLVPGGQMIGGDWNYTRIDNVTNLDIRQTSWRAFGRISYDLTDDINVYAGAQFSRTNSYNTNGSNMFNRADLTVSASNPYLPESVRARATAAGVTSFAFGTTHGDVGNSQPATIRTFTRYNAGADGKLSALGTSWTWNVHFQHSQTKVQNRVFNDIIRPYLRQALDAIVDPATGQIVCRDHSNGCVPYNAFGTGVASAASIDFITGTSYGLEYVKQSSAEAVIGGEPFSTWAGPVSVTTGIDWRRDSDKGTSTSLDQQRAFFFGNFAPIDVSQSVKEAFFETVIPLAKDYGWAKSLDLNGGVRATDYSLAGYVTTWKVGLTYEPFSSLRFRATRSRDIRAPALSEISTAGRTIAGPVFDPLRNELASVLTTTTGNPNLKPEKADTLGIGAVFSPTFIPRLTMSADFYHIKVNGAISSLSNTQVVAGCSDNSQPDFCQFITRGPPTPGQTLGPITGVQVSPVNIAALVTKGIDFEGSYSLPLENLSSNWDGLLSLRALATHTISIRNTNVTGTLEGAGANAAGLGVNATGALTAPKWRYNAVLTLNVDPVTTSLTWRGVSPGKINNGFITCTSSCPVSTAANQTIDANRVAAWNVFDFAISFKRQVNDFNFETYFTVENLANEAPPRIPGQLNSPGFFSGSARPSYYSALGRYFHVGVRVGF